MATVHPITDPTGLLGDIAIDSTVAGRARGGLRMVADLSPEEIRAAARSMTLKYGLLGLPLSNAGTCPTPTWAPRPKTCGR